MMRTPVYLLLGALVVAGCTCKPAKRPTPCDPNPCTDANKTACVVENDEARCICDPHFVLRPSGVCEELSLSNCPEHGGDTAEPDDCIARARPIVTTDAPRSQTVEPLGDYDFYKFTATNRHVYTVTVQGTAPLLPRIDVFDQGGAWLKAEDEVGKATLSFKARYGGQHYFRVSHSPFDPSVATGGYTVSLTSSGAEDHGDGPQEATAITPTVFQRGSTPPAVNGRFEIEDDQDWFTFNTNTGTQYTLAFNPQRQVPYLALYSSSNTTTPLWTNFQETNTFNVTSSGTYYLAVYPDAQNTSTSAYEFQFTRE